MFVNLLIQVSDSEEGWMAELKAALESLTVLLQEENNISAFELHSSGLVQALLYCLNDVSRVYAHNDSTYLLK